WTQFLDRLVLDSINHQIEQFNRYYVLEKECIVGSARLASRHFQPKPLLTREGLRAEFPALPVPGLVGRETKTESRGPRANPNSGARSLAFDRPSVNGPRPSVIGSRPSVIGPRPSTIPAPLPRPPGSGILKRQNRPPDLTRPSRNGARALSRRP